MKIKKKFNRQFLINHFFIENLAFILLFCLFTFTGATPVNDCPEGFSQISVGYSSVLSLRCGVIYSWGKNNEGQLGVSPAPFDYPQPELMPVTSLMNRKIAQISSGDAYSLALDSENVIWAWG